MRYRCCQLNRSECIKNVMHSFPNMFSAVDAIPFTHPMLFSLKTDHAQSVTFPDTPRSLLMFMSSPYSMNILALLKM